jgi:hypothetical protein
MLCTVLCSSVYKSNHIFTLEKAKLQTELSSMQSQRESLQRRAQLDQQESRRILNSYANSQTALVTTSADVTTVVASGHAPVAAKPSSRWGWPWSSTQSTPAPATASVSSTTASTLIATADPRSSAAPSTRTYRATKAELMQVSQLQEELQQVYSAR